MSNTRKYKSVAAQEQGARDLRQNGKTVSEDNFTNTILEDSIYYSSPKKKTYKLATWKQVKKNYKKPYSEQKHIWHVRTDTGFIETAFILRLVNDVIFYRYRDSYTGPIVFMTKKEFKTLGRLTIEK